MPASRELRSLVIQRSGNRCEYCLIHQDDDDVFRFPIDRILSEQHGGTYSPENTALACHHCNSKKGPNIASVVPGTAAPIVALFNPRSQAWSDHFTLSAAKIVGRTPIGSATVSLLDMNTDKNVELRIKAGYVDKLP